MRSVAFFVVFVFAAGCGGRPAAARPEIEATTVERDPDDPSAGPVVPELEGVYCTPAEISGFSGTVLELKGGRFRYWFYSDVRGPDEPKLPLTGPYALRDGKLLLPHRYLHQQEWTPDRVNGLAVLWRADGLHIWREKKRIYDYAVLIRVDAEKADLPEILRPSVTVLYDAETRKRVKEWKDPFVHGPP